MEEYMSTKQLARRLTAGAFFAITSFVPTVAFAQQASIGVAGQAAANAVRADALTDKARSLYDNPKRWSDAAALHRKAAELRPAGDPRGVEDLVMAGRLLYYLEQLTPARMTMIEAADGGLAAGEVGRAANLYLDAAVIARRQALEGKVQELTGRAELLASSTHLDERDRSAILRRVASRESVIADPLP